MNPEKSIEVLHHFVETGAYPSEHTRDEAIKQGIEALRRHIAQQCCQVNVIVGPLPGETEE